MRHPRPAVPGAALAAAAVLAACASPAPTVLPARTPSPAPTVTPPPPDTEDVSIGATGVGTFDLATIPVALVHNAATRHGAAMVVVHFVTHRGSATLGSLDSVPVNLAPGETLPVTADCTDACTGATGTDATLTVGGWVSRPGVSLESAGAAYHCPSCGSGHAHGDVTASLGAAQLGGGAAVTVFAACQAGDGTLVGGGAQQVVWPGGTTFGVDVPVLVSAPPATCMVGASTGW